MEVHFQRARNIPRYRRIVTVFSRHGFGTALEYLHLDRLLSLPASIFKKAKPSAITPAEHLRLALEELGPTFIKLGQVLSTRPDILPPAFIAELSKLQDDIPPLPWETMRMVVIDELGQDPEELFQEIDPQPLGSASLAQVYAATLKDGSAVVLKIQRPNIQETINSDLEILEDLARLAQRTPIGEMHRPLDVINDFSYTLRNELDFHQEGRNADRFRENFADETFLYIPLVYWDYSTRHMLVLERIEGIRINDLEALGTAGYDRHRIAVNSIRIIMKEVLEDGFFHADPHPGNFYVVDGGKIGAMDFGMVGRLSNADRFDLIRLYIAGMRMEERGIVEQLQRMGAIKGQIDRPILERDINRLINKYAGMPLKDIRARDLIDEFMPIVFRHKLSMPSTFWLLAKTLGMMEGIGLQLDPEFDVFEVGKPYINHLSRQLLRPRTWLPQLQANASSWLYLLEEIPQVGSDLLHNLQQGQIPINFDLSASKQTMNRIDRLITRLSLSLLIAGFIVGLGLILPIAVNNTIALWVVIIGFLAIAVMGMWILISIFRASR